MKATSDHVALRDVIAAELRGAPKAPGVISPELASLAAWHRLEAALPDPTAETRLACSLFDSRRSRLLARLSELGIPVMALSGAALVETVYPAGTPRDPDDIDLLVRAERHAEAVDIVTRLGSLHFERGLQVRVHENIVYGIDRCSVDLDGVWERARPSAHGAHLLPSPEDLLIGVCVDFLAKREAQREGALGQVRDISRLAMHPEIDWDLLRRIAVRSGVSARVHLAFAVARQLGLLPVDEALHYFHLDASRVSKFIVSRVLNDRPEAPLAPGPKGRSWFARVGLATTVDELELGRWLRSLA